MIKPRRLRLEVRNHVAQRVPAGEVRRRERRKLRPAADRAQRRAFMMVAGESVEIMSRHKPQDLGENCIMMRHGSILLGNATAFGNSVVLPEALNRADLFPRCGTAVRPAPFRTARPRAGARG